MDWEISFTLYEFLVLVLIAGVCGGIAQAITGFSRGGVMVSVALGFAGALIGVGLARVLDLPRFLVIPVGDTKFPAAWSVLGAVVFAVAVCLLTPGRCRAEENK